MRFHLTTLLLSAGLTASAQSFSFADSLVKYWSDYKAMTEADSSPLVSCSANYDDWQLNIPGAPPNEHYVIRWELDTIGYFHVPATWDGFMEYLTTRGFDKPTTKNPSKREP